MWIQSTRTSQFKLTVSQKPIQRPTKNSRTIRPNNMEPENFQCSEESGRPCALESSETHHTEPNESDCLPQLLKLSRVSHPKSVHIQNLCGGVVSHGCTLKSSKSIDHEKRGNPWSLRDTRIARFENPSLVSPQNDVEYEKLWLLRPYRTFGRWDRF